MTWKTLERSTTTAASSTAVLTISNKLICFTKQTDLLSSNSLINQLHWLRLCWFDMHVRQNPNLLFHVGRIVFAHTHKLFSLPWQISTKLAAVVEQSVFFTSLNFPNCFHCFWCQCFVCKWHLMSLTMTWSCCSKPLTRQKIWMSCIAFDCDLQLWSCNATFCATTQVVQSLWTTAHCHMCISSLAQPPCVLMCIFVLMHLILCLTHFESEDCFAPHSFALTLITQVTMTPKKVVSSGMEMPFCDT